MAHPELATQIAKAKLPYNVNQFSLTAAQVALENLDRFRPAIGAILEERTRLGEELGRLPGRQGISDRSEFFPLRNSGRAAGRVRGAVRAGCPDARRVRLSRCCRGACG